MGQSRRRACLALEPPADHPLPCDDFDRDLPIETLVVRQPNCPEGAGAEPPMQPVAIQNERRGARSPRHTPASARRLAGRGHLARAHGGAFHVTLRVPAVPDRRPNCRSSCTLACEFAYPAVPMVILDFSRTLKER